VWTRTKHLFYFGFPQADSGRSFSCLEIRNVGKIIDGRKRGEKMYCGKCGTELIDGICPKCVQDSTVTAKGYDEKFKDFFMSPNERLITMLGNSYIENFFHNGSVKNGFAVVSDKRIYFRGKRYDVYDDGSVIKTYNSRTVDLTDVTGTGFDYYGDKGWLPVAAVTFVLGIFLFVFAAALITVKNPFASIVAAILIFLGLFMPVYCIYQYFKSKLSLITIQYAGGQIGFNITWFPEQEIELFQKQLRLAKDKAIETNETLSARRLQETLTPVPKSVSSTAEELSKLADLLSKGLITQEEFEKMKKELI